jgi:hypothetical protein
MGTAERKHAFYSRIFEVVVDSVSARAYRYFERGHKLVVFYEGLDARECSDTLAAGGRQKGPYRVPHVRCGGSCIQEKNLKIHKSCTFGCTYVIHCMPNLCTIDNQLCMVDS